MANPPPEGGVPWRAFAAEAERRLREEGFDEPALDARRIVERASGHEGAEYVLGLEEPATERGVSFFDHLLERRLAGEPLQYVLGRWGFRTLDLFIDRRVLIPRPETEVVAGHALTELDRLRHEAEPDRSLVAVDLGTGSGAIALSIAAERTQVEVWATDRSAAALEVARANLVGLGRPATRVRLAEGSWFEALPPELRGTIDLVVSNPPYVAETDSLPSAVVDWEPTGALVAGRTGLEDLELIVAEAPSWLRRPGALVLELAPGQGAPLSRVASQAGFGEIILADDLAGRERVLIARSA